jgi:hypothetical protein
VPVAAGTSLAIEGAAVTPSALDWEGASTINGMASEAAKILLTILTIKLIVQRIIMHLHRTKDSL